MKKQCTHFLYLLAVIFILSSCGNSDEVNLSTSGVYIYHEGALGSSNATIGSYDPESYGYSPSIYRGQNGGFIGDVQQNILLNDGKIYSVLNGSNAIDVMGSNLKSEGKIGFAQLDKPRDIAIRGEIAYISNWGPYNESFALTSSEILVVNLTSKELRDSIDTQEYPEHLFVKGNKLIASHASFDGSIKELSIINTETLEIEQTLAVPTGPQEIIEDDNGDVWVICTSGSLVKLNASLNGIENQIDLGNATLGDVDAYEDKIYFYSDSQIAYLNISDNSINETGITVEMETPYAFAVDPTSGDFYLGDALDFSNEGLVIRFTNDGELLDTFPSGIAPTQFSFQLSRD